MNEFRETLKTCRRAGMSADQTRLELWNHGYLLGRSRWYWGPRWMVSAVGWLRTYRYHVLTGFAATLLAIIFVSLMNLIMDSNVFTGAAVALVVGVAIGAVLARYCEER